MKLRMRWYIWLIMVLVVGLLGACVWFFSGNDKDAQNNKNSNIPIAMALDDRYIYPTIVAITSAMENANPGTKYEFHIMHPSNFSQENMEKLKSLENKYRNKCTINFIDMENRYSSANHCEYISTPAYYRLSLSEILPNLDKVIWLDGDTITFKDLSEMYEIDMQDRYYDGFLDYPWQDEFASLNDHYICSGVMLINLKALRDDDVVNKFDEFIEQNNDKLLKHDQTTINAVCKDKIGVLPAKYGIFNSFGNADKAGEYSDILIAKNKYSKEELIEAFNNPSILHVTLKPWNSKDVYGADAWWDYAKKTDFYNGIKQSYSGVFK